MPVLADSGLVSLPSDRDADDTSQRDLLVSIWEELRVIRMAVVVVTVTAVPLMLLDRQADVFLAKRSGADGWVVKPLDAFTLRRAAVAILEGDGEPTAERALVGDVNPA